MWLDNSRGVKTKKRLGRVGVDPDLSRFRSAAAIAPCTISLRFTYWPPEWIKEWFPGMLSGTKEQLGEDISIYKLVNSTAAMFDLELEGIVGSREGKA